MLSIRRASEADCALIRRLAGEVFPATYREILAPAQLDYMMEWMYSEESLQGQFRAGHVWFIASSDGEPRTIYGRIVAEADRVIDPETIIRRTVQYGLAHCPELDREEQYARCLAHLQQKYAEGGYLRLWIAESENARRLEELRGVIRDPQRLRKMFDAAFDTETAE